MRQLERWCEIAVGLVEALRPGMWLKPLFLMLVAGAYAVHDVPNLRRLLIGFVIIGPILWGGLYMLNAVVDAEDDRTHPIKRHRPFAAGRVPKGMGAVVASFLIAVGLLLSLAQGTLFGLCAALMCFKQLAYSLPPLRLKRVFLCDIASGSLFNSTLRFATGWVLFKATAPMPILVLLVAEAMQLAGFLSSRLFADHGTALERQLGYASTAAHLSKQCVQRAIVACWGIAIVSFLFLCLNSQWHFAENVLGAFPIQALIVLALLVAALPMFGKLITRISSLSRGEVTLYHDLPLAWVFLLSILLVVILRTFR
jgi:4-hydroxybenzoate polyprenyltransferase